MKSLIFFLCLYGLYWTKVYSQEYVASSPYGPYKIISNNTICTLEVKIDSSLWKHVVEKYTDFANVEKQPEADYKARSEIYKLVKDHVDTANSIFRSTKWGVSLTVQFQVRRIDIDFNKCFAKKDVEKRDTLCDDIGIDEYLRIYSLRDHSNYCLSYVFTYRDYEDVIGKAYGTSVSNEPSSACERYILYNIGDLTKDHTKRSLNVGVVTFLNKGTEVPEDVSKLVFTRELGRSFGAELSVDPCKEGEEGINLLSSTASTDDGQNFFSSCAINNITYVLYNLQLVRKGNCLLPPSNAFCGNNIVESGEECDCGLDYDACKEKCCYPRLVTTEDLAQNADAKGCFRKPENQCI